MASREVKQDSADRCSQRIVVYIRNQPAVSCFVLSLLAIAITLASLGVYITGQDHMPDLDAIKVSVTSLAVLAKDKIVLITGSAATILLYHSPL